MLPASPADLFAYLDSLGIVHQTLNHAPVFTVEDARTHDRPAGGYTKNLFLRDKNSWSRRRTRRSN